MVALANICDFDAVNLLTGRGFAVLPLVALLWRNPADQSSSDGLASGWIESYANSGISFAAITCAGDSSDIDANWLEDLF